MSLTRAGPPADAGVFASARELVGADGGDVRRLRYFFVTREDDPVANFEGLRQGWKPPAQGRGTDRPGTGLVNGRWLPLASLVHGALEVKRSTDFVPGRLEAAGHDYRGELAAIVRVAFDYLDVTAHQLARIEKQLLENECRRAEREGPLTHGHRRGG